MNSNLDHFVERHIEHLKGPTKIQITALVVLLLFLLGCDIYTLWLLFRINYQEADGSVAILFLIIFIFTLSWVQVYLLLKKSVKERRELVFFARRVFSSIEDVSEKTK